MCKVLEKISCSWSKIAKMTCSTFNKKNIQMVSVIFHLLKVKIIDVLKQFGTKYKHYYLKCCLLSFFNRTPQKLSLRQGWWKKNERFWIAAQRWSFFSEKLTWCQELQPHLGISQATQPQRSDFIIIWHC